MTLPQWALQSVRWMTSSILRPSIQVGKNLPYLQNFFNREKKSWKKPQEEEDPSPRMDRHVIDVACTEQNDKISIH